MPMAFWRSIIANKVKDEQEQGPSIWRYSMKNELKETICLYPLWFQFLFLFFFPSRHNLFINNIPLLLKLLKFICGALKQMAWDRATRASFNILTFRGAFLQFLALLTVNILQTTSPCYPHNTCIKCPKW